MTSHWELRPMPYTRPGLVLAVCCLSQLTIEINNSIVNLALPVIRSDFNASLTELQ